MILIARLYIHKASGDPLVRGFVWQSVIFGLAGPEQLGLRDGCGTRSVTPLQRGSLLAPNLLQLFSGTKVPPGSF